MCHARWRCFGWLGLLLTLLLGCDSRKSYDRYIPATETARQALEAALSAWQNGQPPGKVDTVSPPAQVVDRHRRPGQRLRGYEILGEVPRSGPRCFMVRLSLDNPREEQKVRFVLVGIDPLWVIRQEDYDMMAHWEHPMQDDSSSDPRTAPKANGRR